MTKLSVNINKIATLRNARGGKMPDLVKAALDCESFGADGITVHPRPDQRHIKYSDVKDLSEVVTKEFNIEGYPSEKFIELVTRFKPTQVTLVPDPPGILTSNAGWDTVKHRAFLQEVIKEFKGHGIRTSIFVDTKLENITGASETGTHRVELYTEPYAANYDSNPQKAIKDFVKAAEIAIQEGLELNAGHDLNLQNLNFFIKNIPAVKEVSIGHALVCDALYMGLENSVKNYRNCLAL